MIKEVFFVPFKKVNAQKELEEACKDDNEIAKYINDFNKKYNKRKSEKQSKPNWFSREVFP